MFKYKNYFLKIAFVALFISNMSPIQAATPSGQFGCILNRNFGGWDLAINGGSSVASNVLMYLDFTAGTGVLILSLQSGYGSNNNSGSTLTVNGVLSVAVNSNLSSAYVGTLQANAGALPMNIIPVNSGNTLLISTALGSDGNNMRDPMTGVCNKT